MSTQSLWTQTADVGYMAEPERASSPSYATVTDFLRLHYGDRPFSVLDCGVLSGVTYTRVRDAGLAVDYTGIDVSEAVLADCRTRFPEARWQPMSVMDLAYPANSFDMVNCRHLLEHLPYYETALREIFRVAREYVAVCLFQVPRSPEVTLRRETENGYIWLNRYAPEPLEALLGALSAEVERHDVTAGTRTDRVYLCKKSTA
jgi:SAM-dependent methyltransferase